LAAALAAGLAAALAAGLAAGLADALATGFTSALAADLGADLADVFFSALGLSAFDSVVSVFFFGVDMMKSEILSYNPPYTYFVKSLTKTRVKYSLI
jgi:hypothetical protein